MRFHFSLNRLPAGTHGIHVHEKGDCTKPDFKSAGKHFNPEAKQHGAENPKGFHAGDLGNIEVGSDGTADVEVTAPQLTLKAVGSFADSSGRYGNHYSRRPGRSKVRS